MSYNAKASALSPERRTEMEARFSVTERKNNPPFNPAAEQLERAFFEPDHWERIPDGERDGDSRYAPTHCGIRFTPPQRRPQRVQDEITRLNHEVGEPRTIPSMRTMLKGLGLDFLRSSLSGRKPLPLKVSHSDPFWQEHRYSTMQLMAEMLERGAAASREALLDRMFEFLNVDLLAAMDSPGRTVIPHGLLPDWSESRLRDALYDGGPFVETAIAVPVPNGYTAYRIARSLAIGALVCWWCGGGYSIHDWDEPEVEYLQVMLVGTGGALHLFPTCDQCKANIGPGSDYYRFSPEHDELRGYPAERHR